MIVSIPAQPGTEMRAAVDHLLDGIEKIRGGLLMLRDHLAIPEKDAGGLDPKDPRNKYEIGGLEKLTPRGVEICYRLFDKGLSRYAVAQSLNISFGAATHRYAAWKKAGGGERDKQPLD
ncbi:DNA-binding NarL/FixJ family response regulator [Brevundimonas alba]|uniref:DNA-binding NarL/FixJ family response regulator n=1 Tax=Brevundimonas alba TaxID=74314 RepID=A0A7X6BNW3_9CAUL|nr:hypothetical protein [Brevundimonas alba]NJC41150.1 DNA-binding NarL/FixJ family response regulator [Brevundimonas alba]